MALTRAMCEQSRRSCATDVRYWLTEPSLHGPCAATGAGGGHLRGRWINPRTARHSRSENHSERGREARGAPGLW